MKTVASESGPLLDVLRLLVPGASNRTLRQMLSQSRIRVNGEVCHLASWQVQPGDVLEIGLRKTPSPLPAGLEIHYEDPHIIVVAKPVGLLTVATPDEREETVFNYLKLYLKQRNPKDRLYIVHRLDKFASGILVFAKSEKVQGSLKNTFSRHDIQRKYWAIVEGKVEKDRGTVRSFLVENKAYRVHSISDPERGKEAITHYRVLRRFPKLTSLEVTLETGRKNQIRVHLSEMGHPIAGDRAYGSTQDPLGRLGLHAFRLGFKHPVTGAPLLFETKPPEKFCKYLAAERR